NSLVWVDHTGKAKPIASFRAPFLRPRLSPDGQRITYSTLGMERHVWIYDLNRGTATNLISEGSADTAAWIPDGRAVALSWAKTGVSNIYWQPADGSSGMERLTRSGYFQSLGSWSPDGQTLAFVELHPETDRDRIQLFNVRNRQVTPFLNSRF